MMRTVTAQTNHTPARPRSDDSGSARYRRLFGPLHITGIFWTRYVAIASWLPRWAGRLVVWLSVAFMYPLLPAKRRILAQNLEGPLGPCGFWGRQVRALRSLLAHGWHLYERFRALNPGCSRPQFLMEGVEVFEKIRASRHGWLLVTAHFGHWELGPVLPLLDGMDARRLHVVREIEEHEDTQRFFEGRLAAVTGGRAVTHYLDQDSHLGVALLQVLRRGDIVTLAGDRRRDAETGIHVTMFGRTVAVPQGPAALARAARVPIVPVFVYQERAGVHRLIARPPIEVARSRDRAADLHAAAQRIANEVARMVRRAPYEWARWEVVWQDRLPTRPERAIHVGAGLVLRPRQASANTWQGQLEVSEQICDGHFPGDPVVPGVALLAAVEAALADWRGATTAGWSAVRFRTPLGPSAECGVRITERARGDLAFVIHRGDDAIADGRIRAAER